MKEPKFHNKNGDLSRYALSCGYVQTLGTFQLFREHSCYHIVGRDKNEKLVRASSWSLSLIRKAFRRLAKGKTTLDSPEMSLSVSP